ncbi:unnamed protein product [Cuscuta campestris]|uniref:Chromo domain-containing protein n=1 Tax=Cuscuta campestris TaxID=132261 RepID=A0A484KJM1_9ASTE|nr:unnamed protein product [Cuscuta campestris]
MGVKNLWDILDSCKKTLPLHHLQNKRVCVDLSCWMVQLLKVNKSYCAHQEKVYLRCLFHRLRALIALNCTIIFVSDGAIPAIKTATYRRRLNLSQEDPNLPKLSSIKRNRGSEFSCVIKEAKVLGKALGIPCLDGVEEAEAQCALLNSESLCDGCFTSDSDAFLFGARTVYRDICLGEGGYVVCYEMDDIERKLGFGRNSLITLAVILGGDYSQGVHGIGRDSACQIVKSLGDSSVLQRITTEGLLSFVKKSKKSRTYVQSDDKENCPFYKDGPKGSECDLQRDKEVLRVINAYLKPKCHSVDSEIVHSVLALYPFQRSEFQQICAKYFEWPPEKTDEYILPKIAERELRRFSNLRSASSNLGLRVSLNEMPIKCPVSSIVKERKAQGKDYFEVSWEAVQGLETSTVPADLVQSACPEKILEFDERRAEKKSKKPNNHQPRRRRVKNMSSSGNEINSKLQALLLQIDQENAAATKQSMPNEALGGVTRLNPTGNNPQLHKTLARLGSSYENEVTSDLSSPPRPSHGQENATSINRSMPNEALEVIDLLSPPPKASHGFGILKCQNDDCVDVIELLSDSETDIFSPDHIKKARELRSFIASIRDVS